MYIIDGQHALFFLKKKLKDTDKKPCFRIEIQVRIGNFSKGKYNLI